MKIQITQFLSKISGQVASGCMLLGLIGCHSFQFQAAQSDLVLIPWYSAAAGQEQMTEIRLSEVSDWSRLSGKFAEFIVNPQYQNNQLIGESPRLQFVRKSNGVRIAQDSLSIQVATLYAHLQNLYEMDVAAGALTLMEWPQKVAIATKTTEGEANNAFYDESVRALIYIPYTKSGLGLSLNAGVIAHEHFHALFHQASAKVRTRSMDQAESVQFRALNEGLADYWAYLYTQRADFVSISLPSKEGAKQSSRNLNPDLASGVMNTEEVSASLILNRHFFTQAEYERFKLGLSYQLGTQLARVLIKVNSLQLPLKNLAETESQRLIQTLSNWNEASDQAKGLSESFISTLSFVRFYMNQNYLLNSEYCEQILTFLRPQSKAKLRCQEVASAEALTVKSYQLIEEPPVDKK